MQLSYSSENNDKKIKKQGTARFLGGVVEEVFGRLLQNLRRKHDRFLLQKHPEAKAEPSSQMIKLFCCESHTAL